ncbi:HlyD family secretion protein [Marinifilum flexuosum]|uniref:HlyD family secretion protein n=1 Tax=Marinifilum flexuosum TaxID=1117708 RepID=UPI002494A511|nr:HlyD family efflux transporter periplasmic adaptor subunit [Marinifilum flexuosum]
MRQIKLYIGLIIAMLVSACNNGDQLSDAYGNFEAVDYMISAENSGKIMGLNLKEGDVFNEPTLVGYIDTTQLFLKKEQLKAQRKSIASGIQNIISRIDVYKEQLVLLQKDKQRIDKMYADEAVSVKEVDDINGNIQVVEKQIKSVQSENAKVLGNIESLDRQIESINDLIAKSKIMVPKAATVLEKYKEPFEMVNAGTPLFKLADLRSLDLRAYISGDQLSSVRIGQKVKVIIDKNADENESLEGEIIWISSQSEFTPKIIQTKQERVKLVYALKVRVVNDGRLKIGMPGEIRF